MQNFITLILCFLFVSISSAQEGFRFLNKKSKVSKVRFQLISNMIIIPAEINDVELSFIIDTGANATFLFNTTNIDSLQLKNKKKLKVRGFGSSRLITAISSKNNTLKVGGIIDTNKSLRLILDDGINFSRRLGIPIHGIIGTDLLSNFITEINYSSKKIKFYEPNLYNYKRIKSYQKSDLEKHKNRYFIKTKMILNNEEITTKMLIDTGSSDTVWLFEDKAQKIEIPKKNFEDYMGMGIGGDVYGKRSRLNKISLGKYYLEQTNLSFPDTTHISLIKSNIGRNGSIGSNFVRRFNLVLDATDNKLYFKKNRFFSDPFEYNMSGLVIEQVGSREVSTFNINIGSVKEGDTFSGADLFKIKLVPIFQVVDVRPDSPSYKAGIKAGDVIVALNKKNLENKKIDEIRQLLSVKEGKEIAMAVSRDGKLLEFKFKLKKIL